MKEAAPKGTVAGFEPRPGACVSVSHSMSGNPQVISRNDGSLTKDDFPQKGPAKRPVFAAAGDECTGLKAGNQAERQQWPLQHPSTQVPARDTHGHSQGPPYAHTSL